MNRVIAFRLSDRVADQIAAKFGDELDSGNVARDLFLAYTRGEIQLPKKSGPAPMVGQFMAYLSERVAVGEIKPCTLDNYAVKLRDKDIAPLLVGTNSEAFARVKKWAEDGCPTFKPLTTRARVEKFYGVRRLFSWAYNTGIVESPIFPGARPLSSRRGKYEVKAKTAKPNGPEKAWEDVRRMFSSAPMDGKIQLARDSKWRIVCSPYSVENLHKAAAEIGLARGYFHKTHYDVPAEFRGLVTARATLIPEADFSFIRSGLSVNDAILAGKALKTAYWSSKKKTPKGQSEKISEAAIAAEQYWESALALEKKRGVCQDWVARATVLLREARLKKVVAEVHLRRKARKAPYLKLLAAASAIVNFSGQNKNLKSMAAAAKQKQA